MTDHNEAMGTFLRVDVTDGWYSIAAHEASVVRKAVTDYRERGIDTVLEVEDRYGEAVAFIASHVTGFRLSTPENRAASILEEIRQTEWDAAFRREHAVPEWGEAA